MKACNKTNVKNFLIIIFAIFLFPTTYKAEVMDGKEVYHVTGTGNTLLTNLRSFTYTYKPGDTTVTYVTDKSECKGDLDTSVTYKVYKSYKIDCRADSPCLYGQKGQSKYQHKYFYRSYKVTTDSVKRLVCNSAGTFGFKCLRSDGTYGSAVSNIGYKFINTWQTTCETDSYKAAKVSGNYAPTGYYSNCVVDDRYKPKYRCLTTAKGTNVETWLKLNTSEAVATNTETGKKVNAYCVNPGKPFPTSSTKYTQETEEFLISDCDNPNTTHKFACGVGSIINYVKQEAAAGRPVSDGALIVALRLWASQNNYTDGNMHLATELATTRPVWRTTGNSIISGEYEKFPSLKQLEKRDYISALNDAGEAELKEAIVLFKKATDSRNISFWSAEISNGTVCPEVDGREGKFKFTLRTNFDENTKDIKIESVSPDVTIRVASEGTCENDPSKRCYEIEGVVKNVETLSEGTTRFNYSIEYNDVRDISASFSLLIPTDSTRQRFITYDESPAQETKKIVKSMCLNIQPPSVCEEDDLTSTNVGLPSNCEDSNAGIIADPRITCLLGELALNNTETTSKYDYTSKYVTSANSKNTYCTVLCRETVLLNLYETPDIKTIGSANLSSSARYLKFDRGIDRDENATLSYITGNRECAVQIDYDAWKAKYDELNKAVLDTWNEYKKWENLHVLTTPTGTKVECSMPSETDTQCDPYSCNPHDCNPHDCNCSTCDADDEDCTPSCDTCYSTCYDTCYVTKTSNACYTSTTHYEWASKNYTRTNEDGSTTTSSTSGEHGDVTCGGSACSGNYCNKTPAGDRNHYAGDYSRAKAAYEKALKDREEHIGFIQSCNLQDKYQLNKYNPSGYTVSDTTNLYTKTTKGYEFDPELTFDYQDINSEHTNIGKKTTLTDVEKPRYCVDCLKRNAELYIEKDLKESKTEKIKYWNCTGKGTSSICKQKEIVVPKNTLAYIGLRKRTNFYQSTTIYSDIKTGVLSTTRGINHMKLSSQNIFPLELDKVVGTYGIESKFSNLGDANRNVAIKFPDGTYTCNYRIENDLIISTCPGPNCPCRDPYNCPNVEPAGYGYYYKQIRTDNVFPSGVKTGTWSTTKATQLIEDIEAKNETVYFETPQYEFIISPQDIKNIKSYNREKESEGTGYSDFDLNCTCVSGGGSESCSCESNFLKSLGKGGSLQQLVSSYKRNGVAQ